MMNSEQMKVYHAILDLFDPRKGVTRGRLK